MQAFEFDALESETENGFWRENQAEGVSGDDISQGKCGKNLEIGSIFRRNFVVSVFCCIPYRRLVTNVTSSVRFVLISLKKKQRLPDFVFFHCSGRPEQNTLSWDLSFISTQFTQFGVVCSKSISCLGNEVQTV